MKILRLGVAALLSVVGYIAVPLPGMAISSGIVIYQVQTGGALSGTASQELITLYNASNDAMNVSGWCVRYSSAGDTPGFQACLTPPNNTTDLMLDAGGIVIFASVELVSANPNFIADATFNGGMAGTGGHLRLWDNNGLEIDRLGWGTATMPEGLPAVSHKSGDTISRSLSTTIVDTDNNSIDFDSVPLLQPLASGLYEVEVVVDVCANLDGVQAVLPIKMLSDEDGACYVDICDALDGLQIDIPEGYELVGGQCAEIQLEDAALLLTELLPNASSYDTGKEFIELYNPNARPINLKGYILQLGPNFSKQYEFTGGVLGPGAFQVYSDSETGIVLPNSSLGSVRLLAPNGAVVSETAAYSNADENLSWAIVNDVWIYTNQITPGSLNKPFLTPAEDEVLGLTTVLAPCPAGKYRNPETNRCRTIETAVSQLVPCAEDEYRNPETNRCKKLVATSTLPPCPEGQERNPETNRCRKNQAVLTSSDVTPEVQDVIVTTTPGSINWSVVTIAVLGTGGYMLYEWRNELRRRFVR